MYGTNGTADKNCVINDDSKDIGTTRFHSGRVDSYEELTVQDVLSNRDVSVVSDFKRNKLERDAQKNWDKFYKRNSTNFFKDRHWTKREFQELSYDGEDCHGEKTVLLEVGCGVGNFIFPLIEEGCRSFFYACDFSARAIQFVKEHPAYDNQQICAFQCDITSHSLSHTVPINSVHIATVIFVLSSISPDKMAASLKNIFQVLAPGGLLLFRDYALHDYAQLRFAPGHKISDNFYFRQDGTRVYYFSLESFYEIATEAGFVVIENTYTHRETVNRKEGINIPRKFIQAKLVKPGNHMN